MVEGGDVVAAFDKLNTLSEVERPRGYALMPQAAGELGGPPAVS